MSTGGQARKEEPVTPVPSGGRTVDNALALHVQCKVRIRETQLICQHGSTSLSDASCMFAFFQSLLSCWNGWPRHFYPRTPCLLLSDFLVTWEG